MGSFWSSGGTIWEVGGELGHMYAKKASYFSFSTFGHEIWARLLVMSRPKDPKIGRSSPEEKAKRLSKEKTVSTSKTMTLSSEMRGFGGREDPKIVKNQSRSGLEGVKSSIVT